MSTVKILLFIGGICLFALSFGSKLQASPSPTPEPSASASAPDLLKPADYVQLLGTIVSAGVAACLALVGVHLGNQNARKVQQDQAEEQRSQHLRVEEERLTALLKAVREEISVSWNTYVLQVGQMVETAAERKQKLPYWPCYGDYFIVFKTNATNIGMIRNDALRAALVESYMLAQGHIDTFQNFNRLLAESDRAKRWWHLVKRRSEQSQGESDVQSQAEAEAAAAIRLLRDFLPHVTDSHSRLKKAVERACTTSGY